MYKFYLTLLNFFFFSDTPEIFCCNIATTASSEKELIEFLEVVFYKDNIVFIFSL